MNMPFPWWLFLLLKLKPMTPLYISSKTYFFPSQVQNLKGTSLHVKFMIFCLFLCRVVRVLAIMKRLHQTIPAMKTHWQSRTRGCVQRAVNPTPPTTPMASSRKKTTPANGPTAPPQSQASEPRLPRPLVYPPWLSASTPTPMTWEPWPQMVSRTRSVLWDRSWSRSLVIRAMRWVEAQHFSLSLSLSLWFLKYFWYLASLHLIFSALFSL